MTPAVAFVGELYWDHLFVTGRDGLSYLGGRGGGSAANSAFAVGPEAMISAARGEDELGVAAEAELAGAGVEVWPELTRYPTRQMFEVLSPAGATFSARCPVCEHRHQRHSPPTVALPWGQDADPRWLAFDGLSAHRARLARQARKRGVRAAAHLSFPGQLRFNAATQVAAWLREFEIVALEHPVAESLLRRLGLGNARQLAALLPGTVIVSRPGEQVQILRGARHKSIGWPLPSKTDPSGVSDLAFGRGLARLMRSRSGMAAVATVLEAVIAELPPATCLPGARSYTREGSAPPRRRSSSELLQILDEHGVCPVCGSVLSQLGRAPVSRRTGGGSPAGARRNVSRVIRRMLLAAERQLAVDGACSVLQEPGSAYAVGSGGSFAVAMMIATLIGRHGGSLCQPLRPNDYLELGVRTDTVVVVTYSGRTQDCAEAIRHAHKLRAGRVVLVTGAPEPLLAGLLDPDRGDLLISYGESRNGHRASPEGGFVSIAGVLAPAAVWTAAAVGPHHLTDVAIAVEQTRESDRGVAERLADGVRRGSSLAILTHGLAWAAALDVESKVTEADLTDVQLHELKDFSHGRFMSVLNAGRTPRQPLVIAVGKRTGYERALLRTLRGELADGVRPQEVRSTLGDDLGALELLVRVQFISAELGLHLDRDISRPEYISPGGLNLYRWSSTRALGPRD